MITEVVAGENQVGRRADIVATEAMPTLSREYVHALFESNNILVNQKVAKVGQRLRLGDKLSIDFDLQLNQKIESIELPVIYEDSNVIVIDKPSGIISHSRGRYWYEPSVASFIREKTGQEGERSGIVHRLDRATSGVMICAKNSSSLSWLQKQFSSRTVKKSYVAIVSGHVKDKSAIIDMPIKRNPKRPQTFRVGPNGKTAQTKYKVIKSFGNHDKLELTPLTGRTHQLRVHLKQLGHPIVGDTLYGHEDFERLLLHAASLEIVLPEGERHTFRAPEPPEFNAFEVKYG